MKINFKISLLAAIIFLSVRVNAKEGMWVPSMLDIVFNDMKAAGLKLTEEDIYSIKQSSLKDAIVHFGGGCTASLISADGLILTNHHCGFSQIQYHSTLENDYLRDGFVAKGMDDELPNPGLTASVILDIEDITSYVFDGYDENEEGANFKAHAAERIKILVEETDAEEGYSAVIKPFYNGMQYIKFTIKTYSDVRLVFAPPSGIGKFGEDTDNWMWPRHTGDFSIFRIYAADGVEPAAYSEKNSPLKSTKFLEINAKGPREGDFTMIYGFPGRTQQYLTSYAVDYIMNKSNPAKITMRDQSLAIINQAMSSSDELRIKYAAKQSRISNAHKKWIGENRGLRKLNAIEEKQKFEAKYLENIHAKGLKGSFPDTILAQYKKLYENGAPYELAREFFIELFYYGPEIIRFSDRFSNLIEAVENKESQEKIDKITADILKGSERYFKDYDVGVDERLFAKLLETYQKNMDEDLLPPIFKTINSKYKGDYKKYAAFVYGKSVFTSKESLDKLFSKGASKGAISKLKKDPAYAFRSSFVQHYFDVIKPTQQQFADKIADLDRYYMEFLMGYMPKARKYYPDANSTLRVAFGRVEGYEPADGVRYDAFTTLDGVMAKENPNVREFTIPEKLKQLYKDKDYGRYGKNGVMPVNFIASNHSTGGNSGSPVLDADGKLIGLNFDRCWEGTMSDIMFDPDRCRNIMVDMRYMLFIVDKFGGAENLINEMKINF